MTLKQAIEQAVRKARKNDKTYFVVADDEDGYTVATEEDLDTFYAGEEPVFCTDEIL